MKRFIEWDSIEVRVSGEKLSAMAREMTRAEPMIERLELQFSNGLLRVVGAVRKFFLIPFTVEITEIRAKGTTVRVPLARISAATLPIPTLLVGLVRKNLPPELMSYEDPATIVVSLDRFLPPFVSADIQKIWIIDGGLAVILGRGGADLPTGGTADDAVRPDPGQPSG